MNEKQLREFYELCQRYRTTPSTEFVTVSEAYNDLFQFVNKLTSPLKAEIEYQRESKTQTQQAWELAFKRGRTLEKEIKRLQTEKNDWMNASSINNTTITDRQVEVEQLRTELLLLKTEREMELLTNTKSLFSGTEIMVRNEVLEKENKLLREGLELIIKGWQGIDDESAHDSVVIARKVLGVKE